MKALVGDGPSRGLLRDCKTSRNLCHGLELQTSSGAENLNLMDLVCCGSNLFCPYTIKGLFIQDYIQINIAPSIIVNKMVYLLKRSVNCQ